jgi:site-specific DNA-methyltransferase (adenine-specific)
MSATSKLSVYRDATDRWRLIEGDAQALLAKLPENSVDCVVADPPYGIDLGGEAWDRFGGGGLAAPEAFERWTARWAAEAKRVLKPGAHAAIFGAPRTFHRLVAGIEDSGLEIRDQLLWLYGTGMPKSRPLPGGLATTLKPSYEPVLLARTPLVGTTKDNLDAWGTGALNIDATRIGERGYWPAHLTLSHAQDCRYGSCATGCPVQLLDQEQENLSRLFFCAKAIRAEREAGCEQLPARQVQLYTGSGRPARVRRNTHLTVKPVELMRWLVRLVTPPGGTVLDPFTGSGSTGIAAVLEGRVFLGIEREARYVDVACARLTHWAHKAARESS